MQVGGGPIARVELRYETAATLVLRGVLDPEGDPQHKRIVDKYACENSASVPVRHGQVSRERSAVMFLRAPTKLRVTAAQRGAHSTNASWTKYACESTTSVRVRAVAGCTPFEGSA